MGFTLTITLIMALILRYWLNNYPPVLIFIPGFIVCLFWIIKIGSHLTGATSSPTLPEHLQSVSRNRKVFWEIKKGGLFFIFLGLISLIVTKVGWLIMLFGIPLYLYGLVRY